MLDSTSVLIRLEKVFQKILNRAPLSLRADTTAADIPQWDSLNHIQLMAATEADFGVRFSLGEMADLTNVGQLVELIQKKLEP